MMNEKKTHLLLIDNYDSFTYNLYDYFLRLGVDCTVIRNDSLSVDEFKKIEFDILVFSPGPKTPSDAGCMMQLLDYYYDKKPILGICLGHQAIGIYFGATLQKAKTPMHGKTSIIKHNFHPVFNSLPIQLEVMRYHSLIVTDFELTALDIIAQTDDGEIMALAHKTLPIIGFQFHPESILTHCGLALLSNTLQYFESSSVKNLHLAK